MDASAIRRYCTAFFLMVTALLAMPLVSADAAESSLKAAPLNPAFVEYVTGRMDRFMSINREVIPRGFVPSPVDMSYLKGVKIFEETKAALPSTYDLRNTGKLTRVEDQATCGSCWTFSTLGSMESVMMPGENCNFSQNNLKNLSGFDRDCCGGGDEFMAMAYLARWAGPMNESDDPHNPNSCTSPSGLTVRKHLQNGIIVPDRADPLDNDDIKQAVVTYGAVSTGMYWDDGSYNESTHSYYYTGGEQYGNHMVCIVGWDDNYSKNKFSPAAPGNGAFIIKNSWGNDWGENGFFYVSYYDYLIGISNWVGVGTEPTNNYKAIYQYDPLGLCNNYGYNSETIWFANKFTASPTSSISAVGWYVMSPQSTYEISIYTDPTSGPIYGGTLKLKQSGTAAHPGYVTIKLNSLVSVTSGHKFTVMVKTTTPGYTYPLAIEYPIDQYSSRASSEPDQSYSSSDGEDWYDLDYYDANACLKAYVAADVSSVSTPTFSPDGGTYTKAQKVAISCATSGAEIHYSVNGVDPTTSDPKITSGATLTVEKSLTLKAKAWKSGMNPSAVKSALYTIRPSHIPTNDSLSPSSGYFRGYWKYTFVSKHSDTAGANTISSARFLINTSVSGANAVYCIYSGNKLYLRTNDGASNLGGYAPGADKVIENSQCKLYCKDTKITRSGNTLTVNWAIEMKPSMAEKACCGWLYVTDSDGSSKGWDKAGELTFRSLHEPWNVCVIPDISTLNTGVKYMLSGVYFDIAHCTSISLAGLLLNTQLASSNGVYLLYDVQTNKLYLRNDAGTANLGGFAPGSDNVIENKQCKLYCNQTTIVKRMNGLVINWRIEMKSSMAGKICKGWLYVRDTAKLANGWDLLGQYTIK